MRYKINLKNDNNEIGKRKSRQFAKMNGLKQSIKKTCFDQTAEVGNALVMRLQDANFGQAETK